MSNNWYDENYPKDKNREVYVVKSHGKILGKVSSKDENCYKRLSELISSAGDCEIDYESVVATN
jgi:hypothetical protein